MGKILNEFEERVVGDALDEYAKAAPVQILKDACVSIKTKLLTEPVRKTRQKKDEKVK